MKRMLSWKKMMVVLSVFVMSMVCIPGLSVTAMAADPAPTATAEGASAAGASGGSATFAGISTGTLVAGTVAAAAAVVWVVGAASYDRDTTTPTTSHH